MAFSSFNSINSFINKRKLAAIQSITFSGATSQTVATKTQYTFTSSGTITLGSSTTMLVVLVGGGGGGGGNNSTNDYGGGGGRRWWSIL